MKNKEIFVVVVQATGKFTSFNAERVYGVFRSEYEANRRANEFVFDLNSNAIHNYYSFRVESHYLY